MAVLLERDEDTASLLGLVEDVLAGRGRTVVLQGEAGIGKTSLLDALVASSGERVRVLRASGMPLASQVTYGVLRDLLAPLRPTSVDAEDAWADDALVAARALGLSPAPSGFSTDPGSIAYGLHRLATDAADRVPLLLVVDDLHWADEASVTALGYLAQRSEGSNLGIVLATRLLPDGPIADVVEHLLASVADVLEPDPLSAAATGVLVGRVLDGLAGTALGEACHEACGRNPFLVQELARAVLEGGVTDLDAAAVLALGAVAGGPMLRRLGRLRGIEHDIATAVAVLDVEAALQLVADFIGHDPATVAEVADGLVARHVLAPGRPLRFAHPLLAAAVEGGLPEGRRSVLHRRAARLLTDLQADHQVVAAHLLRCDPGVDAWAAEQLLLAATELVTLAEWSGAHTLSTRAVAEGAHGSDVSVILGFAEIYRGDEAGLDHIRSVTFAPEDPRRTTIPITLARSEARFGHGERGVERLRALAREAPDLDLSLAGSIAALGSYLGAVNELVAPERNRLLALDAADLDDLPDVLATLSMLRALEGTTPASTIVPQALGSLEALRAGGALVSQEAMMASAALSLTGHPDASDWLDQVAGALHSRKQNIARGPLHRLRHGGSLAAVVAECEGTPRPNPDRPPSDHLVGALLEALVAMGRLHEAANALSARAEPTQPSTDEAAEAAALFGAAALREAQGRPTEAEALLEQVAVRCMAIRAFNPAVHPWRSRLGVLRARRGDPTASDLVAEEVALARTFGAPLPIGVALTAAATMDPDHRSAAATLAEAVLHLDGAPLDRARALVALAVRTVRGGDRNQAREHLAAALDLAAAIGADPLADQAREELVALGARPRRARSTGVEALTASERRVAELAAAGRSNPEIAEELYLSRKTVETHLSRCYTKLGIAGRSDLEGAFAG